jgi:hypothetical protein
MVRVQVRVKAVGLFGGEVWLGLGTHKNRCCEKGEGAFLLHLVFIGLSFLKVWLGGNILTLSFQA